MAEHKPPPPRRRAAELDPSPLREARERAGYTQNEAAELTGVGRATLQRFERGDLPQALEQFARLAQLLGLGNRIDLLLDEQLLERAAVQVAEARAHVASEGIERRREIRRRAYARKQSLRL
jgi:transcriptional regulator with XRE-family HTH domain